ncbi:MAG: hypothetical protein ACXAEL_00950 [Candidatus Hodarchaeales archaeon]
MTTIDRHRCEFIYIKKNFMELEEGKGVRWGFQDTNNSILENLGREIRMLREFYIPDKAFTGV